MKENDDILGRYDETELVELSRSDVHGGTWTPITPEIAFTLSEAFCPTAGVWCD
jgi:hypothetical protein